MEERTTSRVVTPKRLRRAGYQLSQCGERRRGREELGAAVEGRRRGFAEAGTYRLGSKTPAALRTSAVMGTVELTGLDITQTNALGQYSAMATAMSRTIPALMLKRSSRVIPGCARKKGGG